MDEPGTKQPSRRHPEKKQTCEKCDYSKNKTLIKKWLLALKKQILLSIIYSLMLTHSNENQAEVKNFSII
jgi:hypothetical protein